MTPEEIEYWYSERAAILHFCGGFDLEEADRLAQLELELNLELAGRRSEAEVANVCAVGGPR